MFTSRLEGSQALMVSCDGGLHGSALVAGGLTEAGALQMRPEWSRFDDVQFLGRFDEDIRVGVCHGQEPAGKVFATVGLVGG